jgi:hypothetical protein
MPPYDSRHDVDGVFLFVSHDFESIAPQNHAAFGALEDHATHPRLGITGSAFPELGHGLTTRILDNRVPDMGHPQLSFR